MSTVEVPLPSPSELAHYFDRLWPLLRSISGAGVRQTLDVLSEIVPLQQIEVPSGTEVFDWTVPKEWVLREAYLIDPDGRRFCDVRENNLHLLNYSIGFRGTLPLEELQTHLYSLPEKPTAIPYLTSYYAPKWGFCLTDEQRKTLKPGNYQVVIDAEHVEGSITIAEAVLPGRSNKEVLFSTYTCHPSMASNELSGPLVTAFLYRALAAEPARRFTYRFLFLPETIGSISFLKLRGEHLKRQLVAGYVVTCIGDAGAFTYKKSRRADNFADRAMLHALQHFGEDYKTVDFAPYGSDERQFCSPGLDLPVGVIMRTMFGEYPQYHTSLDNRAFISFEAMCRSVELLRSVVRVFEANTIYQRVEPHCEPNLGKRGLYPTTRFQEPVQQFLALLWLLNLADGSRDLLSIAERSGYPIDQLDKKARICIDKQLLTELSPH